MNDTQQHAPKPTSLPPAPTGQHKPSYYLTTPIYYVNGVPHLGTAYTTVAADALARHKRMDGFDAWFLTGLDEHGQKVATTAAEAGVTPQQWVDSIAPRFKEAWAMLDIAYDDFIRTTELRHARGVQRFFEEVERNGYLYRDTYGGWYCVHEETHFNDDELGEAEPEGGVPLCPDCKRPLKHIEEENIFFRLSAFQDRLLAFYEENPEFVCPQTRRNEVLSFVRGGLKDLSVSRTTFDWGVPITFAPGHVSYVWFDALINYVSAVGYGGDTDASSTLSCPEAPTAASFDKRWPAQVHFVGKDIIRFHCVIWPAMLMAAGLKPPQRVFAHGFLLTKGEKMSKSRGNALAPAELVATFGVDAYRYYFLSDVQFGADGSISLERMVQVYNADLANSWGNLCSRVLNMTEKYCGGTVPGLWDKTVARLTRDKGNPLAEAAAGLYERCTRAFDALDYSGAMAAVQELCARANLYVEETAPWTIAKLAQEERLEAQKAGIDLDADAASGGPTAPTQEDYLSFVLYNALESLRLMALFFAPVMPQTSAEVWRRLGLGDLASLDCLKEASAWGGLPAGNKVTVGGPLFPRLDIAEL
ncbi:MAG: methionine--tRNA ligase [Coriobacteriales bacterium]|jgi:methionyl-tRNA synthetase|nr:methionine--tRNA ligase [Coriobacteriales bacterium]